MVLRTPTGKLSVAKPREKLKCAYSWVSCEKCTRKMACKIYAGYKMLEAQLSPIKGA